MTTPSQLAAGACITGAGVIFLTASRDTADPDDITMFGAGLLLITIGWGITAGLIV